MATWLDTVFANFDFAILEAIHSFSLSAGNFFIALMSALTHLCDGGLGMIALGLFLCLFKRTRKVGTAILFAVGIAALITNVTVKPLVARARPYNSMNVAYREWWSVMGAHAESEFSFPSGHTTAATAAMLAVFLNTKKKYSWPVLLFPFLMGFTRLMLVVHYPSDILGGLVCGSVGALLSFLLWRFLWRLMESHREKTPIRWYFDLDPIVNLFRRITARTSQKEAQEDTASSDQ